MRLAPHELQYIETLAVSQLEEFYSLRPDEPRVPTPVENLLELHLGLGLLYMDLKSTLENDSILGALNVPGGEVWIDHSLDPETHPELEGRYRFTIAHEIAHWCLHRQENLTPGEFAYQSDEREEIREKEADAFAAALLMPEIELTDRWLSMYGDQRVCLSDLMPRRQEIVNEEIVRRRFVPKNNSEATDMMLDWAVTEIAEVFCVSPMAMRIRCEQFGLVVR